MDKLKEVIESRVNKDGKKYGLKFTDQSYWPFLGDHSGKRLKNIPTDFWVTYLNEKDFDKLDDWSKHANQYQTTLGKLLAYAKRRIRKDQKPKGPRNQWKRTRMWIHNGKGRHQFVEKSLPIPEGWQKGFTAHGGHSKMSDEARRKIGEGLRKYYQTREGKLHRLKLKENPNRLGTGEKTH